MLLKVTELYMVYTYKMQLTKYQVEQTWFLETLRFTAVNSTYVYTLWLYFD